MGVWVCRRLWVWVGGCADWVGLSLQGAVPFTVESLAVALAVLLFIYWPAQSFLYNLITVRPPMGCWTIFTLVRTQPPTQAHTER
jgi:hypothetical protein